MIVGGDGWGQVADLTNALAFDTPEGEANARLMAAAPTLLAALEALLAAPKVQGNSETSDTWDARQQAARDAARAAIAKAKENA